MEQQHAPDREREEVDVGVQPTLGVGIVLLLFLARAVVKPVGVVGFAHPLELQLGGAGPQPDAGARSLLDVEEILVGDGSHAEEGTRGGGWLAVLRGAGLGRGRQLRATPWRRRS